MFSRSFSISATFGFDTVCTLPTIWPRAMAVSRVHTGVAPPATMGVLAVVYSSLPGSMRSGLWARK